MKSKILIAVTTMLVVAALSVPIRLASQSQTTHFRHYKLIDLGTFGGPSSYLAIHNGVNDAPNKVLNSGGIAAGWADTSTPDPYAPNCLNTDCFTSHAFQWQNGTRIDLGVLPGGQSSSAAWISDTGLIAGQSQNGVVDPLVPGFPEIRAVLWKGGQIINLGTLGGNESSAFSVNKRGQVVGVAVNTIPDPFSFLATQLRAFLWQDGAMQDLGTLGGPEAWALFVNESGQVAGFSFTSATVNPITGFPTQDPFLWENGTMLDLGTLGGTFGWPLGLNNQGQVVGESNVTGDLFFHPFLWTSPGPMQDLGTLGGDCGTAFAINDTGVVVGAANFEPGTCGRVPHAFIWTQDGGIKDLGTLNGDNCAQANAINSVGQIVGISRKCDFSRARAVLWENGQIFDLDTLVAPGAGLTMTIAGYINDLGEIAGMGFPTGCTVKDFDLCTHAYVLIPVCEDGTEGCADAPLDPTLAQTAEPLAESTAPSANSRQLTEAEIISQPRYRFAIARRNLRLGLAPPKN